jgi:TatD DNase family protein
MHPNWLTQEPADAWDAVRRWAAHPAVVAVGETGLDRYRDRTPFPLQEEFFARHLELARSEGLPVIIHCRQADADVLRMLRADFDRHGPVRGVVHSFAGPAETAEAALAMGLHLSFSGTLTYKDGEELRRVAASAPADRILVETDSPYLTPVPLRGKQRRNEPAFVVHTAACLALQRGLPPGELAELTTRNARELFRRQKAG